MSSNKPDKPQKAPSGSRWDDSHVRTSAPEIWNVAWTREEIALVFGTLRNSGPGREPVCELGDRILMSPFVAKRLGLVLEACIRRYESSYGVLELGTGPDILVGASVPALQGPPSGPGDYADGLVRLVRELDVPIAFERSFKMCRETLLEKRFLLGVNKKEIDRPNEWIMPLCNRMNMPPALMEQFVKGLPNANYVHFGFEENGATCFYKVYLEFHEEIERRMMESGTSSGRYLLHLGFKWVPWDNGRQVITRYVWEPFIGYERIARNLSGILDPHRSGALTEITKEIMQIALKRIPHQDLLFLETTEEGTPRKSFDLNVYRAGIRIDEVYPLLLRLCSHYGITGERFHRVYEPARDRVLGHIAGGMDREGKDFLTVYYGVESLQNETHTPLPARAGTSKRGVTQGEHVTAIEERDERAGLLHRLVRELNVKVGFERSFKLLKGNLLSDRFLAGFRRTQGESSLDTRILEICRAVEMPPDHLSLFEKRLPESNIVLFGFEKDRETRLCKAYLEFGEGMPDRPEPYLIHMGFKWSVSNPSNKVLAKYTCFPGLTQEEILRRVTEGFYQGDRGKLLDPIKRMLELGSAKADPRGFLYFEADEENNPRSSFDINIYPANLRMEELYPCLVELMSFFSIPEEYFVGLYRTIRSQVFGHLTGGLDRQGRDFMTIYCGERGSTR